VLEKILFVISDDLLERVILILLIGALFHFIEGDAEYDVKQNCDSLAVEDHTLKKPVVVDIVNELKRGRFVILHLIIVEIRTKFQIIALLQMSQNFLNRSLLELYLHLDVQERKYVNEDVSLPQELENVLRIEPSLIG
jgi:hypothetical protein